ncbi:hypothetical protein Tco_1000272, partial [Tanacetum coccineum]
VKTKGKAKLRVKEGIEDAIVVPAVLADELELKIELLDFVSDNSFFGLENDDPHSHIWRFYQITQTLRLNQVPDDVVKLILLPFSLKKEQPRHGLKMNLLISSHLGMIYNTDPRAELNVITSMDGLTLDRSFTPHSNRLVYQEKEQELETIAEVVEIDSSQSTPLVPPLKTPPFNKVPIQNDKNSGSPILSPDPVVESISPSLTPFGDIDLLLEETDAFLALDSIPPYIDDGIYDLEGDILFLDGLLSDEIPRDLPPLEVNNDPEGDILFLENLLKDEPLDVEESKIYPLIRESSNTFLMGDEEIKVDPFKEINDPILNPKASKTILDSIDSISDSEEPETKTIMDEIHSTVQIPPLFEELTSDKSIHDIILHQIRHGMVNSSHLSFYLGLLFLEDNFESLSSDSFELGHTDHGDDVANSLRRRQNAQATVSERSGDGVIDFGDGAAANESFPIEILALIDDLGIIDSLIVSATPKKPENEATSTKLPAITPLVSVHFFFPSNKVIFCLMSAVFYF